MPIYEYQCKKCQHEMEALQKMSDDPLLKCPECGKSSLKRLVSAPGFRLKGGGWYETDFKSKNRKNVVQENPADKGVAKKESPAVKKESSASDSSGKDKSTG